MTSNYSKTTQKISVFFSSLFSKSREKKGTQKKNAQINYFGAENETQLKSDPSSQPIKEFSFDKINKTRIMPKQLITGVAKDVGLQRKNNEDSLFSLATIIDSNESSTAFGIFIVADGMGGHNNGEIASDLAVRTVSDYLVNNLFPAIFSPSPFAPEKSLQEIFSNAFAQSNEKIINHSNGGGTTLTAVLTIGTQISIAHLGDSRAYSLAKDGKIEALTQDHSYVNQLIEMGQITEEEAKTHPHKSTLYKALGQKNNPEPDIINAIFPDAGYLMICSDGLWGVLSDESMVAIVFKAPSPQQACQDLVDAANAAGGPDNIAVILVKLSE